ncbi:MAG: DUF493 family protein [Spirochaetes bacterium]|nr:DUF493 family protein [Spirochaetota bacterium]
MSDSKQKDEFPRELTFKIVYRRSSIVEPLIQVEMEALNKTYTLTEKESAKKKFSSYTISSHYETEAELTEVCNALASIDGFMMMV